MAGGAVSCERVRKGRVMYGGGGWEVKSVARWWDPEGVVWVVCGGAMKLLAVLPESRQLRGAKVE